MGVLNISPSGAYNVVDLKISHFSVLKFCCNFLLFVTINNCDSKSHFRDLAPKKKQFQ